jgi:hypothetical protein
VDSKPNRWILALALLPVGAAFVLTLTLGVNFPYVDDWSRATLMAKAHDGDVGISDLWATENVHRSFVPRVVATQVALMTSWNQRGEMLTSLLCGCLALILLGRVVARESAWFVPLAALFLFSMHSWKNFLWGIQTNVALANLFVIVAISVLAAPTVTLFRIVGASVTGMLASYAFLSGFLIWPVGGFILLFRPCESRRKRWALIGAWFVAGLAATAIHVLVGATGTPPGPENEQTLMRVAEFVTRFFGAGLVGRADEAALYVAGIVGQLALILSIGWLVMRARERASAIGLAGFGLYSLACAYAIGLGRTATMGHSASSRYTAFSGFAWFVMLAVFWLMTRNRASALRSVARVVVVCVIAVMLLHYPASLRRAQDHSRELSLARDAFVGKRALSLPALQGTFGGNPAPWLPLLATRLDAMRPLGLSFFADIPVDQRMPQELDRPVSKIAVTVTLHDADRRPQLLVRAEHGVPGAAAALIVMDKGELADGGLMPILNSMRAREGTLILAFDEGGRVTFEPRIPKSRIDQGLELMVLSLDRRGWMHRSEPTPWPQ